MSKIQQAIDIVNKRLPVSYLSEFKVFKTCSQMLRWYSKRHDNDYGELLDFYDDYFKSAKTNTYMETKYSGRPSVLTNKRECFTICAIADNPIIIAENNIRDRSVSAIVFLLIHELGHLYLERKNRDIYNERFCDLFAIRWVRKMTKEGIFND